jgi:transcriptional regulator with XRE-family HTH domain
MSLHAVEKKSKGRWKAVVVGSYERGERAVTVARLAGLAEFYGIPIAELLPDPREIGPGSPYARLVIDLERIAELPARQVGPLARYAAAIQSQRGDYKGTILSIRSPDLRSLAVIYDMSPENLVDQLMHWRVLRAGTEPG